MRRRFKFLLTVSGSILLGLSSESAFAQSPAPVKVHVVPLDASDFQHIFNSNPEDIPILVRHRQDPNALRPSESLQAAPRQQSSGSEMARNLLGTPPRNDIASRRNRLRLVASSQNRAAPMIGDMFGGGTTELSLTRIVGDVIPYANFPSNGSNFNSFVGFNDAGAAQGPFYAGPANGDIFPQLTAIGIDTNNDSVQDTFPNLLQYTFLNGRGDPNSIEDAGPFDAVINSGKTIVTPNGDTVPVLQLQQEVVLDNVPSPSEGGIVGRVKIGENTSPMPRDRIYFNYSYFNGVPLVSQGADVNRFTPGIEKTILDGTASIELRVPFASTIDSNISSTGLTAGENLEFGNVSLTYKSLFYNDETFAFSGGLQLELPSGDPVNVNLANGTTIVRIKNQAVHLMPFVGALYTPDDRFFTQAFTQFDFAANGNDVLANLDMTDLRQVGTVQDASYVYLDWSAGYWAYLADDPSAFVTGIAPIFELHFNQSLQASDVVKAPGNFQIGTNDRNRSVLNAVLGTTFQFGPSSALTMAYTTPIGGGNDQQFNGEFRLFFNRRFGPQSVQSRAF